MPTSRTTPDPNSESPRHERYWTQNGSATVGDDAVWCNRHAQFEYYETRAAAAARRRAARLEAGWRSHQ